MLQHAHTPEQSGLCAGPHRGSNAQGPGTTSPPARVLKWTFYTQGSGVLPDSAFSLSQIQLLLRTAARVSSLKHRPERVTPPLEGHGGQAVPENRLVPPPGVSFSMGQKSSFVLRLGSSLCPVQPSTCPPAPGPSESSPELWGPHALPVGTN